MKRFRATETSPYFSFHIYGIDASRDIFASRQLLVDASCSARCTRRQSESDRQLDQIITCFALARSLISAMRLRRWEPLAECPRQTLARHDIPMAWDFAEVGDLRVSQVGLSRPSCPGRPNQFSPPTSPGDVRPRSSKRMPATIPCQPNALRCGLLIHRITMPFPTRISATSSTSGKSVRSTSNVSHWADAKEGGMRC